MPTLRRRAVRKAAPTLKRKVASKAKSATKKAKLLYPKLKKLGEKFLTANRAKNDAAAIERARRKDLMEAIEAEAPKAGTVLTLTDGYTLEVGMSTEGKDTSYVDIQLLKENTTEEQFMEIVSATQKAVIDAVGANILNKCLKTDEAEETDPHPTMTLNKPKK